jgi:chromosome segregation ATPase
MTDETTNLVLEHLRRLREETREGFADLRGGFSELKHRMAALEQAVGNLQVQVGQQLGQTTILMGSMHKQIARGDDRIDDVGQQLSSLSQRVDRIERQLNLKPA